MKLRDLTYEEARERHPQAVEAIIWRLRRSRSMARLLPAFELQWTYECCLRVDGPINWEQSQEDRLWDEVSRTGTSLQARGGRWKGVEVIPNPPEVVGMVRERIKRYPRRSSNIESRAET